jgi:hypothetical protein
MKAIRAGSVEVGLTHVGGHEHGEAAIAVLVHSYG